MFFLQPIGSSCGSWSRCTPKIHRSTLQKVLGVSKCSSSGVLRNEGHHPPPQSFLSLDGNTHTATQAPNLEIIFSSLLPFTSISSPLLVLSTYLSSQIQNPHLSLYLTPTLSQTSLIWTSTIVHCPANPSSMGQLVPSLKHVKKDSVTALQTPQWVDTR